MTEMAQPSLKPRIEIRYCTLCRWMLRAAWLAQELLSTFDSDLGEVALVPASKGEFKILVNGIQGWDRVADHLDYALTVIMAATGMTADDVDAPPAPVPLNTGN